MIPTRKTVVGKSASFKPPSVPILPHSLCDADAEAVKKKMIEERTEERESKAMGEQDVNTEVQVTGDAGVSSANPDVIAVDDQGEGLPSSLPSSSMPVHAGEVVVDSVFDDDVTDASFLPAMESQVDMPHDVGQAAPVTPPMSSMQLPPTPRQPHGTRLHDDETQVEQEAKKAKTEQQKKQRLNQIMQYNESMIRVVKIGSDEFATMDGYTTELNMGEDILEDELWADEDQVKPAVPPHWIDKLADEVEINRLLSMGVLQRKADSSLEPVGTLTTRFVYDWRKKMHKSGVEKWMRRSRFVAREFASEKRSDTYPQQQVVTLQI